MIIANKAEFFRLWEAGVLGNRTRLWHDPVEAWKWGLIEAAKSDKDVEIGFREVNKSGGGGKWQKVPWREVRTTAAQWKKEGRTFIMDDGAPDDKRTLQGEVCRTIRGLEGYLDVSGDLAMRPAMAAGRMRHCSAAMVLALLDHFMDPSSRDDLDGLLELYPDATIEFSCFSVDVGIFPNRNTIFWETRNY